jgi:hypothetical protein
MSATVKPRKTEFGECHLGWDQRKVTLPQSLKWPVKYHVTMYGTSCTPHLLPQFLLPALNGILGSPPLFSGLSLWTQIHLVTAGLLNKLASWKLWGPSLWASLQHSGACGQDLGSGVFTSLSLTQRQAEDCLFQVPWTHWSEGREPFSWQTKETSSSCTKEPRKAQESTWGPCSPDW